ncbi:hypothetical protein [Streptomyces orinoci]|uniref:Uncharacterized protein n=1 Tax=Streptomyces orinoci TaxID=67339 RepID=A0ABV3K6J1_STRON|nr:hypothetical protein [Streptomyces orinoci]
MGEPLQSRILDYYDEADREKGQDDGLSYATPVFVPAHPRY